MIWLLGATVQVSAILVVALGLAWLVRKRSAGLRHAVILMALVGAGVVPVLGVLVPTRAVRVFSVPSAPYKGAANQPAQAAEIRLPEADIPVTVARALPVPSSSWRASLPRLLDIGWIVYVAGLAVSLALLAIGLLQLRWMAARTVPMRSESWRRQMDAVANACGLRRTVELGRSPHTSVLATWGLVRPQVLLPAGAEDWSERRIRAVLLHEFAHIRRNDWLVQVVAAMLRAIYWFNPLVWIACARLGQESEHACDDAVIRQGVDGAEYAMHLLDIARGFALPAFMPMPPPSMARRSTLRRRVAEILNPAAVHTRASRLSVVMIVAVLVPVTLAVAACQVASPPFRKADIRPRQSTAGVTYHEEPSPAQPLPPARTTLRDAPVIAPTKPLLAKTSPPEIQDAPALVADVRESSEHASLQAMAYETVDLAQSLLIKNISGPTRDYEHLRGSIGSVQRTAQRVVDDGRDTASVTARSVALLAALNDAANSAANISVRPGTPSSDRQALQQIEARLRTEAGELATVLLPLPAVRSIVVSTPERRAAITALDLAQTARADPSLGGWRPHVSLLAGLDTLERAAQSVLMGDDADHDAAAGKLTSLSTAILLTERVAANISSRDVEPGEARRKAAELASSLRAIDTRLGVATPSSDDTRWSGWALPDQYPPEHH